MLEPLERAVGRDLLLLAVRATVVDVWLWEHGGGCLLFSMCAAARPSLLTFRSGSFDVVSEIKAVKK